MSSTELKTCMGKNPFPFMKWKWPFLLISILAFGYSTFEIFGKGLNFGVDFLGGTKIIATFKNPNESQIRDVGESLKVGEVQVVPFGTKGNQFMVRMKFVEGRDVVEDFKKALKTKFGETGFEILSSESVGPKVGEDLRNKGILSMLITCVLILIYVGFRFDFHFAPGAIVALLHDVVISAGVFAITGREFNLPILAVLLTILGYSINDTIVIYDRIRDNLKKLPKSASLVEVIDISLTETFSRTIVTSLTVFLVAGSLFIFGGSVLHDFAFCLMVGLVFGSYSSLFVASPLYIGLQKLFPGKEKRTINTKNSTDMATAA